MCYDGKISRKLLPIFQKLTSSNYIISEEKGLKTVKTIGQEKNHGRFFPDPKTVKRQRNDS
jgi:hypothetical protein